MTVAPEVTLLAAAMAGQHERAERLDAQLEIALAALREIGRTGPVFDARGTWSRRVTKIARDAQARIAEFDCREEVA